MSVLLSLAALLALGVVQIFLPQVWSGFGVVDWLLIYIVVQALRSPFRKSILLGAGGGLIQDGLAGGILGLHAFAKTSVAALIAAFGGFMVVRGPLPEAIVVGAATALEGLIVMAWQMMLGRPVSIDLIDVVIRAVATAIATFAALSALRRWEQRASRKSRGGRR